MEPKEALALTSLLLKNYGAFIPGKELATAWLKQLSLSYGHHYNAPCFSSRTLVGASFLFCGTFGAIGFSCCAARDWALSTRGTGRIEDAIRFSFDIQTGDFLM